MNKKIIFKQKKYNFSNKLLEGIWRSLKIRRRWQLMLLSILMLASGFAEILSMTAIVPFLSILTDPETIWNFEIIKTLSRLFKIYDANDLLIPVTCFFIIIILLSTSIRLVTLWLSNRLAALIGTDLSLEAYKRTIYQPYEVHLKKNTSSTITTTTTHINTTVVVLNLILQFATSLVVAVGLVTFLILLDWVVAFTTIFIFGSLYILLAQFSKKRLHKNSKIVAEATNSQMKSLQEGLGAIRDVLLDNSQQIYLSYYKKSDKPMREKLAESQFLSAFPRYAFEAIGLIMIAGIAIILTTNSSNTISAIPLLGTLALGAQRLLPSMQKIYGAWAGIKARANSVFFVLEMVQLPIKNEIVNYDKKELKLNQKIEFKNIFFRYDSAEPYILNDFNLEINFGECIGLIGETGSGKSTILDLMLGLLKPTKGSILIDDKNINFNAELLKEWQRKVAYVPQEIYLADISILENIGFGIPKAQIDISRVYEAAKKAKILDLIESWDKGFNSFVGERGVRLSGGQRQRVGIARALYKCPEVLIFDEGTSSLDNATEAAVMKSIYTLANDLTIIIVAHRLSTVARCDKVYKLRSGRVDTA